MIKSFYLHSKKAFVFIMLLVVLMGCSKTLPSRFYSLSTVSMGAKEISSSPNEGKMTIEIGPLKLADYLNRPQIVTRENQNEITLAEYDRWAGQLSDELLRIISENLSVLLSTDRVVTYPWRGSAAMSYQIEIEIIQFDGRPGENVVLIARWIVTDTQSKEVVTMKRSSFIETASEGGYAGLVAAQSRAVGALSREISVIIRGVSNKNSE